MEHYMKMSLIDERTQGRVWRSVLRLNNEALVLYVQSLIDKTNNSNESARATGGTFSFRHEFEGRLFIQSAVWLGFHGVVAMVLPARPHLKRISLWLKM